MAVKVDVGVLMIEAEVIWRCVETASKSELDRPPQRINTQRSFGVQWRKLDRCAIGLRSASVFLTLIFVASIPSSQFGNIAIRFSCCVSIDHIERRHHCVV